VARKLIVKGIQHPHDAVLAADWRRPTRSSCPTTGAACSIAPPAYLVLPQVVDAVGKRITVIVDSGFAAAAMWSRRLPWAPTP